MGGKTCSDEYNRGRLLLCRDSKLGSNSDIMNGGRMFTGLSRKAAAHRTC